MYDDSINLSQKAADGISLALDQNFNKIELPDRMAWIVLLLRKIEDKDEYFPMGKWATIQSIEGQLDAAANQEIQRTKIAHSVVASGAGEFNIR